MASNSVLYPLFHATSALPYSVHIKIQEHEQISRIEGHNHLLIPLDKSNLGTQNSGGVNRTMMVMVVGSACFHRSLNPRSASLWKQWSELAASLLKNQKTRRGTKSFPSHLLPVNKIWMDFLMFQSTSLWTAKKFIKPARRVILPVSVNSYDRGVTAYTQRAL